MVKPRPEIAQGGKTTKVAKVQPVSGYTGLPESTYVDPGIKIIDYYRNGGGGYSAKEITPLEFEGPASIAVYGSKGGKKEGNLITPYTKFILNSVQEAHVERSQIVETFSDFYVFFYGERPPVYTYNGTLINTKNANWVADFFYYYENHLRGTKCAESNARIILTYGYRQVEGYITNFSMQTNAETDAGVPVSFQVIITRRNQFGYSADFGLGEGNPAQALMDWTKGALAEGRTGKGMSKPDVSDARNIAQNFLQKSEYSLLS